MREVEKVLIVVAEVQGCGVIVLRKMVSQQRRQEKVCLYATVSFSIQIPGLGGQLTLVPNLR